MGLCVYSLLCFAFLLLLCGFNFSMCSLDYCAYTSYCDEPTIGFSTVGFDLDTVAQPIGDQGLT
jgi:hypothetical protein